MADIDKINDFIQSYLKKNKLSSITVVEIASHLDKQGLLKDREDRRGAPLRSLCRKGKIHCSSQPNCRNWIIKYDSYNILVRGNRRRMAFEKQRLRMGLQADDYSDLVSAVSSWSRGRWKQEDNLVAPVTRTGCVAHRGVVTGRELFLRLAFVASC